MTDHNQSREEVAAQAVAVRAELKTWEKEFINTHGKKASREDIKDRPDIAAKYKEYGQLKNLEAALTRRENRQHHTMESPSKKRKHASPTGPAYDNNSAITPRKSAKGIFATPSNNRTKIHPSQLDPYDSPSTFRRLFSPSSHVHGLAAPSPLKAAIGPTPQRDGKALGLFDMLSESGGSSRATPSAKRHKDVLGAGFQTPSKPKHFEPIAEEPEEEEESSRLSRTPASSTKQFYLANLFATPTTMRYAAMVEAEDNNMKEGDMHAPEAPVSRHSNPSETPSFLRRSNSNRFPPPSTNNNGLSPIASRKPLQFAGRGLSHLVQGLRDMEEERLEDEWDILREIEEEQEAMNFQVPESQPVENERPYKKKGQKRTTRRVIMRPVISKPKPKTQEPDPIPSDEEFEEEIAAVPETQVQDVPSDIENAYGDIGDDVASLHSISEAGSDFEGDTEADDSDDPEYGEKAKPVSRPKSFSDRLREAVEKSEPTTMEPPAKPMKKQEPEKEEKQPRARKLNPQAHVNYRSLKIGNKGSRGRGRFRRR
ncbi:hypothetical protein N7488_005886 [Penicillium malachiteum]|nr:hypothetical protein N7488_005886 [Penicillium malachiteum]